MAQAAKSQEPSMEEILASIRRIIAEDDSEKSAPRPVEAPAAELNPDTAASSLGAARSMGDSYPMPAPEISTSSIGTFPGPAKPTRSPPVLELSEPPSPSPRVVAPTPETDPASVSAAPVDQAGADEVAGESRAARDDEGSTLMSTATSTAVDSAFNALAQTVLVHNARTLEDLVREMLRPMLKVWLDDNLPGMVERLVRAEIERVSRGRVG